MELIFYVFLSVARDYDEEYYPHILRFIEQGCVKLAENVDQFKIRLESYKSKYFDKPGHYWELSDEIFKRINETNRQSYVDFMRKNPHIAKRKCVNVNM